MEPGRVCMAEGCSTVLSRWNPSPTCSIHNGWAAGEARVGKGESAMAGVVDLILELEEERCDLD